MKELVTIFNRWNESLFSYIVKNINSSKYSRSIFIMDYVISKYDYSTWNTFIDDGQKLDG